MMLKLIAITLRQKRIGLIAYSMAGLAMIGMYIAIYPMLQAQADSLTQVVKSLPPALLKAFGSDNLGMANFEGLAGIKHYGFVWPLLAAFLAISFAGGALAGEVEKGTMGLWLSAPLSRAKIYWSKYWAGTLAVVGFTLVTVTAVIPLAGLAQVELSAADFLALSVSGGLFGLAILSITMVISSLVSEKGRVYGIMGALLLAMYVANVIAEIAGQVSALKYLSFFHYFGPELILRGHAIDPWAYAVFGVVIVASAILGAVTFQRRDIAV
jgi:ABC-2 type transport system permease protein